MFNMCELRCPGPPISFSCSVRFGLTSFTPADHLLPTCIHVGATTKKYLFNVAPSLSPPPSTLRGKQFIGCHDLLVVWRSVPEAAHGILREVTRSTAKHLIRNVPSSGPWSSAARVPTRGRAPDSVPIAEALWERIRVSEHGASDRSNDDGPVGGDVPTSLKI